MRSLRCEECGRPILMSDTQCFHCGAAIPGREPVAIEVDENGIQWRASIRLGGVVLALMAVGMVLTNWMGKGFDGTPAAVVAASGPPGWQEYIPPDQTFQIWLPGDWEIETPRDPNWQELVKRLPEPLPNSFRQIAPELLAKRVSLVAMGKTAQDRRPVLVSVQLHPGLAHYSLISLQVDDWSDGVSAIETAGRTELLVRESGDSVLIADLFHPWLGEAEGARSLVMLMRSANGIYAVTISADRADFERHERTLRLILGHFQLLDIRRGLDSF